MSDNTTTLLLVGGVAAGVYYMYTKKIGLFAPASSVASLSPTSGASSNPMTGTSMMVPITTDTTPQPYGGTPATVPSPVISATPNYYDLPTYQGPIVTRNVDGGVTNWEGVTTYAGQLQVVLAGKGVATPAGYAGIYTCMQNVSGGGSMSADAWGQILGQCIGGSAAPGAMVTGSYDSSPMSLNAYWRFISPFGVPNTSIAGLGRMPSTRSAFAV